MRWRGFEILAASSNSHQVSSYSGTRCDSAAQTPLGTSPSPLSKPRLGATTRWSKPLPSSPTAVSAHSSTAALCSRRGPRAPPLPARLHPHQMSSYSETRFDNAAQMPLGVSLNFSSLAARSLAAVAVNPASLLLMLALGEGTVRTIRDAGRYAGERRARRMRAGSWSVFWRAAGSLLGAGAWVCLRALGG